VTQIAIKRNQYRKFEKAIIEIDNIEDLAIITHALKEQLVKDRNCVKTSSDRDYYYNRIARVGSMLKQMEIA
jgi:hypothetical protein